MATATNQDRAARLRAVHEHGKGDEYASAVGLIAAVVTHPEDYNVPLAEIRQIIAVLDEVTGYDRD